jgi:hypothetical protein
VLKISGFVEEGYGCVQVEGLGIARGSTIEPEERIDSHNKQSYEGVYLSADLASNDVLSSKGDWKSCRCTATRRSLGSHLHIIIPPSHFASFSDMLSAVNFEEMSECPA